VIVVDSSVFVALLAKEADAANLSAALSLAERRIMSAATYLECAIVATGRFRGRQELDDWLRLRAVEIVPVDHALAQVAADAFSRYGKGRHPAGLNFGDCFAYALARSLNAPLLFKGDDFPLTDVIHALP
jgi:ribonuclease VapC